jgi:N-hydroxyarylamine O-acetyltransferase
MCHYHQTSPESHFTQNRICSRATPEGRVTLSNGKLIETQNLTRQEKALSDQDWIAYLWERFGVVLP